MTTPNSNSVNKIAFVIINYSFEVSPTIKDMISFLSDNNFKVDILTDKFYRDNKFTINGVNVIAMEYLPGKDTSFYRKFLEGYEYVFAIDYPALTFLDTIKASLSNVVYLSLESNQHMLKEPKEVPLNLLNKCKLGIIQSDERCSDLKKYFDNKLTLSFEYLPVCMRPVKISAEKNFARIIYSGYLSEWSGMLEFIKLFSVSRYRGFFEMIVQGHAMGTEYYARALKEASVMAANIVIDQNFYEDEHHVKLLSSSNIGVAVYKIAENTPNWDNLLFSSGKIAAYLWTGCAVITNLKYELTSRPPFIFLNDLQDIASLEKGFEHYLNNMELYYTEALLLANKYYNMDKYAKSIVEKITCRSIKNTTLPNSINVPIISNTIITEIENNSNTLTKDGYDIISKITNKKGLNNGLIKLHLGCGETYLNGYINVDYPVSEHNVMKIKPDVYADITKIELPENLVDEIRLHHVFEHFNRVTALSMLIKWQSSLKVGGLLHIETPDLIGCAKVLTSNVSFKTKMGISRHLAGDQAAHWAYQLDHWFAERYEHTLSAFGFDKIQIKNWNWEHEPYLANIEVKAVKSQVFSADRLLSIGESLLWDSTVADIEQPTYLIWVEQLRRAVRGEEISE